MSAQSILSRFLSAARRFAARTRPGHAAALSVVAVAALGLAGLRAIDLPGPRPVRDGERIRIEVVHPVEPEIVAGSRMEVGELVDGFQGVPSPLPALTDAAWSHDEAWDQADDYEPRGSSDRRPPTEDRAPRYLPEPERESPARMVQRWFGFDAPRRDFEAERAARRARQEAMELDARERQDRRRRDYERAERDRYIVERRRGDPRPPTWEEDRRYREAREDERRAPMWREAGPRPYEPEDTRDADAADWNG